MKNTGIVFESEMSMDVEPSADTLYDKSRFESNGVITTATWVRSPSGLWVLDFNSATPDYVTIPAAANQLNFTTQDFSIVMMLFTNSLVGGKLPFARGWLSIDGYYIYIHDNGAVYFYTSQAAAYQESFTAPGAVVISTWYTLGISRIGTSVRIYVDGTDATSVIGTHTDPLTSARNAMIGIHNNLTSNPFDGKIGFCRIYNYALSAGKHLNMHNMLEQWV